MHTRSILVAVLAAAVSVASADENRPHIYFPRHIKRAFVNATSTQDSPHTIPPVLAPTPVPSVSSTSDSTSHYDTSKRLTSDDIFSSSSLSSPAQSRSSISSSSDKRSSGTGKSDVTTVIIATSTIVVPPKNAATTKSTPKSSKNAATTKSSLKSSPDNRISPESSSGILVFPGVGVTAASSSSSSTTLTTSKTSKTSKTAKASTTSTASKTSSSITKDPPSVSSGGSFNLLSSTKLSTIDVSSGVGPAGAGTGGTTSSTAAETADGTKSTKPKTTNTASSKTGAKSSSVEGTSPSSVSVVSSVVGTAPASSSMSTKSSVSSTQSSFSESASPNVVPANGTNTPTTSPVSSSSLEASSSSLKASSSSLKASSSSLKASPSSLKASPSSLKASPSSLKASPTSPITPVSTKNTTEPYVPHASPTSTKSTVTPTGSSSLIVSPTAVSSEPWLPTTILVQPTPSSVSASGSSQTPSGIPSGLPKVITPDTGNGPIPEDSVEIQIAFEYGLNWQFVATKAKAAAQIANNLPQLLSEQGGFPLDQTVFRNLKPLDTVDQLGYTTTMATCTYPKSSINRLALDLKIKTAPIWNNNNELLHNLSKQINPALCILDGTNLYFPTDSGGDPQATSTNEAGDLFNNNSSSQTPSQRGATAGIAFGAIAVSAAYGTAMFVIARRYKRRKQSIHHRSDSMPTPSEMRQAGSPALMGGALLSRDFTSSYGGVAGGAGGRDSHGSGRSGMGNSGRTAFISAPVAAENSLGWN